MASSAIINRWGPGLKSCPIVCDVTATEDTKEDTAVCIARLYCSDDFCRQGCLESLRFLRLFELSILNTV